MGVEKLFTSYRSSNQYELKYNKLESKCLDEEAKNERSSLEKTSMNIINDPIEECDEKKIENCDNNESEEEDIELIGKGLQGLQLEIESDSSKSEENGQDGLCSRGPIKFERSFPIHSLKPYEFNNIITESPERYSSSPDEFNNIITESPERLYSSSPDEFTTDSTGFLSASPVSSYSSNSPTNCEQISCNEHLPLDNLFYQNQLYPENSHISNIFCVTINETSNEIIQSISEKNDLPKNDLFGDVDVDVKYGDPNFALGILKSIDRGNPQVNQDLPETVQEINSAVQEIPNQINNKIDSPTLADKHIKGTVNNDLSNIFHTNIKKNFPKKILPNGVETRNPFSILNDLKKKMNESVYRKTENTLKNYSISQLTKGDDKDNDTELMVMCTKNLTNKLEKVIALINRIRDEPGALEHENNRGLDALYHACFFMTKQPLVACYITEILAKKKYNIGSTAKCSLKGKYEKGDTIIHMIARRGDHYAELLANLLLFQKSNGTPFNLEARNEQDETPLYVAVKVHGEDNIRSIEIVKQLVLNNANIYEKNCPMQLAINKNDPSLLDAITKFKNKHDFTK